MRGGRGSCEKRGWSPREEKIKYVSFFSPHPNLSSFFAINLHNVTFLLPKRGSGKKGDCSQSTSFYLALFNV